jgi:hypothetical protein
VSAVLSLTVLAIVVAIAEIVRYRREHRPRDDERGAAVGETIRLDREQT